MKALIRLQAIWHARSLWTLLCMLPLGCLGWLLSGVELQVPVLDQWALPIFFARVSAGTAGFADLFAHLGKTPHQIAVPRLLFTVLAFASNWNLAWERYLSLLLAAVTLLLCWRIATDEARRQGWELGVAMVTTSFLIFAMSAAWNWLWGFSAILFFIDACVVAAAAALLPGDNARWGMRLATAAVCCMLATFSLGHGTLSWIALLPSVVRLAFATRRRRTVMAVWFALAVIAWGLFAWSLFAWGYDLQTSKIHSRFEVLGPVGVIVYYFRLLGVPIASVVDSTFGRVVVAPSVGLALVCSYVVCAVHFLSRSPNRTRAIPWLSIGLFSMLYAGLNSMGRATAGTESIRWLYAQMYSTPAVLLSVAVVQLCWLAVGADDGAWRRWARVTLVLVALATVISFPLHVSFFRWMHYRMLSDQHYIEQCLELAPHWTPSDPCHRIAVTYGDKMRSLDELGFRPIRWNLTFDASPSRRAGSILAVEVGKPPKGGRPIVIVRGDSTAAESTVLFTETGEKVFFAHCHVDRDGRWEARYEKREPPRSAEAWVYDAETGRLSRLEGKVEY